MEIEIIESVADRLSRALRIRKMRQSDLAMMTGIDKGSISCYCSGRYSPKDDKIFLMAMALQVNPAWLSGFDVPMEEQNLPPLEDSRDSAYEEAIRLFQRISPEKQQEVLRYLRFVASTEESE
ncbi:MAG: helix-turn-helix transcriptional regulator [Clostridia bacterium]|nr:helix-turn-helix transcriptional regulator [Clostridia bacterium]